MEVFANADLFSFIHNLVFQLKSEILDSLLLAEDRDQNLNLKDAFAKKNLLK